MSNLKIFLDGVDVLFSPPVCGTDCASDVSSSALSLHDFKVLRAVGTTCWASYLETLVWAWFPFSINSLYTPELSFRHTPTPKSFGVV